jgi:hypothetical protein
MILYRIILIVGLLYNISSIAQKVGILEYDGGGDWYANPTSVPNLIKYSNEHAQTRIAPQPDYVRPDSPDIFKYPLIFITGHGNILFDDDSAENLKKYLTSGGFIHISDNYGLDPYVRKAFKKIFPQQEFKEIPYDHPIYHEVYNFDNGLPKIHEHDGKPPKGYGLFHNGRLVVFYDYECDLSDGWEAPEVHHDPQEIREQALKMGINIIRYAFTE